ncbi:MAG: FitA-like ribbon-helix-helix domain-containing protein [Gemmatimonadota bacterium]
MATTIQIRNVPPEVHRRAKARAALAGMSLSDYILREIEWAFERPTRAELLERIARLPGVELDPPSPEVIRAERDGR